MSQTINRNFERLEQAEKAAIALRNGGRLSFADVHVISGQGDAGAAKTVDDIVADLVRIRVLKAHARILAAGLKPAGALVIVHAAFGTATRAISILDSFGPVESGVPDFTDAAEAWDEATPMSNILQMPVLLPDSASFSRFWNLPLLSRSTATTSSRLGFRELSSSTGPFTGTFGMSLLTSNSTSLSSMLGLPLLTRGSSARP